MPQEHNNVEITQELLEKMKAKKSSWEYIEEAEKTAKKLKSNSELWRSFAVGKEWYVFGTNGKPGQWYRRTESGRIPIDEPKWYKEKTGAVPWFCPKCKKIMKRDSDSKWYRAKGHCTLCQYEYTAKAEMEAIKMKTIPGYAEKMLKKQEKNATL